MMFLGVVVGAIMGLFFHQDSWAGGYASFRRRMLRLAHVSFFGIGFINLLYGLTLQVIDIKPVLAIIASRGFLVGGLLMPTVCFLTAWKTTFRHLFPIPVIGVLIGITSLLMGWALL